MTASFFLAIFPCTLISYYFYDYGVAPFPLVGAFAIGALALFFPRASDPGDARSFWVVILYIIYLLGSGVVAAAVNAFPLLFNRFSLVILVPAVLLGIRAMLRASPRDFHRAIGYVLVVHLIFFYAQILMYVISGTVVDFIEPFTGEAQRVFTGSYASPIFSDSFMRASGLFAEPGTYANVIFPLYLLYESVGSRYGIANQGKYRYFNKMGIIVAISMILSFSIFGYIFIIVYMLLMLKGGSSFHGLTLAALVMGGFSYISLDYLGDRIALGAAGGLDVRLSGIDRYLDELSVHNFVFGWGVLAETTSRHDVVYNDLGLSLYLMITTGVCGLILFLGICLSRWRYFMRSEWAMLIVLLLSKLSLTYVVLWVFVSYLLFMKRLPVSGETGRAVIGEIGYSPVGSSAKGVVASEK